MIITALRMLIGQKNKYFGIVFGVMLASLLITQQSAILLGLITRAYAAVTDIPQPSIWVMDPTTVNVDSKVRAMNYEYVDKVRSVSGVSWAVPILIAIQEVRTPGGVFYPSQIIGIDDATLIGAPKKMIEGNPRDLYIKGGVIIDEDSAKGTFAKKNADGTSIPLGIGDSLEVGDKEVVVVGICERSPHIFPDPIIYTTFSQATAFFNYPRKSVSFILAQPVEGVSVDEACRRIHEATQLKAVSVDGVKAIVFSYFIKTGVLINFALTVAFGFFLGLSIVGQIFYNFVIDNLRYFAVLKAMGATKKTLLSMIFTQSIVVACLGYGLGVGLAALFGFFITESVAFYMPWQLLVFSGVAILLICLGSAAFCMSHVIKTDPAEVFRG